MLDVECKKPWQRSCCTPLTINHSALNIAFWKLPVDGGKAARLQVLVGAGKMPATQEAAMRRQGRRMRRLQHQMALPVDQPALLLRVAAPEQEHQPFALAVQVADD